MLLNPYNNLFKPPNPLLTHGLIHHCKQSIDLFTILLAMTKTTFLNSFRMDPMGLSSLNAVIGSVYLWDGATVVFIYFFKGANAPGN